jgi:hypothetical protein
MNYPFHFVLQKRFEEGVCKVYVDALLFLLGLLTHGFHHDFPDFPLSLLSFLDGLVALFHNFIERVDLRFPLGLLVNDRLLNRLQHISASVAYFGSIEFIILYSFEFDFILFKG